MERLIKKIRENLTDDLLKPEYKDKPWPAGHCYVASECFYYLYGKDNGWYPMCGTRVDENGTKETHWWLESGMIILDLTADQFDEEYDYSIGRKQFFVSYPSKRCKILAKRVIKSGANN